MAGASRAADRSATSFSGNTNQPDGDADQATADSSKRIDAMIRQLGSPKFTVRRMAASELDKIGPEAFDQLYAATSDADPEIAASAKYVLRGISVRWTRSDDSARVRQIFRTYGEQDDDDHKRVLGLLTDLPDGEGIAGLCRIARFDRSPLVSRLAALAVIIPDDQEDTDRTIDPAAMSRELGASTRPAAIWLKQYVIQLHDPAASVKGWQTLVDDELKRLSSNSDETSSRIATDLLWNLADVYRRLGDTKQLLGVVDQMMGVSGDEADDVLTSTLKWLVDHQAWEALNAFATKYDARIGTAKGPLYLVAFARAQQGNKELAEQLAERASHLEAKQPLASLDEADVLVKLGQTDWAIRECRQSIEDQPVESPVAIAARVLVSRLLEDGERYQESADAIDPLVKALEKNRALEPQYENVQRIFAESVQHPMDLPDRTTLGPHTHFLRACSFEQQRDWPHQREELLQALSPKDRDGVADEEDADVLIAMYRVPDADDAWRADTRKRIDTLAQAIQQQIEQNPNAPNSYNQWAWLISNTEGDLPKALRYSQKSLELLAESGSEQRQSLSRASYLDTLGRCYYAVGDLENAIKNEREAIRLDPHLLVMQRQLAMFEKAAEKKGSGIGVQGSGQVEKALH
jgi:tetratricopeptide (TPR) repeat protein